MINSLNYTNRMSYQPNFGHSRLVIEDDKSYDALSEWNVLNAGDRTPITLNRGDHLTRNPKVDRAYAVNANEILMQLPNNEVVIINSSETNQLRLAD